LKSQPNTDVRNINKTLGRAANGNPLTTEQSHLKRAYQGLGTGLVVLGLLHMAATFQAFDTISDAAVWFFGSGIAMALTGVLNLLNVRYGHAASGIRSCCIATNVAMCVFAAVAGVVTNATVPEFAIILGLIGVLSLHRGALTVSEFEA
jgi:hypothetical protein